MQDLIFMADTKGKCCDCEKDKPLDEMIRKYKGLYHCIDCEVDKLYNFSMIGEKETVTEIQMSRTAKLFRWAFG